MCHIHPIEAKAFERIEAIALELTAILDRARQGSLLRNGLHVVLVGQRRTGKSNPLDCPLPDDGDARDDNDGTASLALAERWRDTLSK